MTLGRTDKNKIKIKTDSPKGTRAVNCACCNTCGCNGVAIPENLRPLFEAATIDSITMWGYPPEDFFPLGPAEGYLEGSWAADWFVVDGNLFINGGLLYSPNGCLYGINIEYNADTDYYDAALIWFGQLEGCLTPSEPGATGTFTINGTGEYPWYYLTGELFVPPPVPLDIVILES